MQVNQPLSKAKCESLVSKSVFSPNPFHRSLVTGHKLSKLSLWVATSSQWEVDWWQVTSTTSAHLATAARRTTTTQQSAHAPANGRPRTVHNNIQHCTTLPSTAQHYGTDNNNTTVGGRWTNGRPWPGSQGSAPADKQTNNSHRPTWTLHNNTLCSSAATPPFTA